MRPAGPRLFRITRVGWTWAFYWDANNNPLITVSHWQRGWVISAGRWRIASPAVRKLLQARKQN